MQRYKVFLVALIVCFVSSLVFADKEPKEILVFAGAGMRAPLNESGEIIEKLYGVRILYDYGGSGRLGNKILAGQTPDVYIPGSGKWAKILKAKGYVEDYSPVAYHDPVIITPQRSGKVNSLDDFSDKGNRLVLGDVKACAIGEASAVIFEKAGMEESAMNIISRGFTVKQLILWIEGNNADAAIVWKADAIQSGRVKIIEIPVKYGIRSIIPVCLMLKRKKEANVYIHYLLSEAGRAIFKKHGFNVME
ncbi:MAG: molybdate ABC transporter substrate-binding protein [Thermodesulfobacteriota bacterium]|nr:molybdate ABC transporter substrate-binding protein [Thermodesulfobacteriota bacterium]